LILHLLPYYKVKDIHLSSAQSETSASRVIPQNRFTDNSNDFKITR